MEPDPESPAGRTDRARLGAFTLSALALVLLVVAVIRLLPDDSSESRREAAGEPPQRGLACPPLREAESHLLERDEASFRLSVLAAAAVAERVLDTSGQLFGPPERAALELRHLVRITGPSSRQIDRWLDMASRSCESLEATAG